MSIATLKPVETGPIIETPESKLRKELGGLLRNAVNAYEKAREAFNTLGGLVHLGPSFGLPYEYELIDTVFEDWLGRVISRAEEAGRGDSKATIGISDLNKHLVTVCKYSSRVQSRHGGQPLRRCSSVLQECVNDILEGYDFNALQTQLTKLSEELEERGLVEAADKIARDLGMIECWGRSTGPKKTKAWTVFSRSLYCDSFGYGYSSVEELVKLADNMDTAEKTSGVYGVSAALRTLIDEIGHGHKQLPSRTKFCEGTACEIVVYKEKIDLRMTHDLADGIMAFIASYTSEELRKPNEEVK